MTRLAALAAGRRVAEEGMLDTCEVFVPGSVRVFDRKTGKYTSSEAPIYKGRCRLKALAALAGTQESGQAVYMVERLVLSLPFGTEFQVGATVHYLTSDTNPALVGNQYRVTGLAEMSQATAQRLSVELVSDGN